MANILSCAAHYLVSAHHENFQRNSNSAPLRVNMRQTQADATGASGYIDSFSHCGNPSAEGLLPSIFFSSDRTMRSTNVFIIKSGK
jgi:hypothetical protein